MSRGGWILLAGGLLLVIGIALAAISILGLMGGFIPSVDRLGPGQYLNTTVQLRAGEPSTYVVGIENYSQGDELTVFLLLPSGAERNRTTVMSSNPLVGTLVAEETGTHTLVIQNTGSEEVPVLHSISRIDVGSALWVGVGMLLGFAGFIVLIVGLVVWLIDRRKR